MFWASVHTTGSGVFNFPRPCGLVERAHVAHPSLPEVALLWLHTLTVWSF